MRGVGSVRNGEGDITEFASICFAAFRVQCNAAAADRQWLEIVGDTRRFAACAGLIVHCNFCVRHIFFFLRVYVFFFVER